MIDASQNDRLDLTLFPCFKLKHSCWLKWCRMCVCGVYFRPYFCSSSVCVRADTGQCGGVQSRTLPPAAHRPRHLPLEATVTGSHPQAAVDLGSSHIKEGTESVKDAETFWKSNLLQFNWYKCDSSQNNRANLFYVLCRIFSLSYRLSVSAMRPSFLPVFLLKRAQTSLKTHSRPSSQLGQRGNGPIRTSLNLQPRRLWEMEPDLQLTCPPGNQAPLESSSSQWHIFE